MPGSWVVPVEASPLAGLRVYAPVSAGKNTEAYGIIIRHHLLSGRNGQLKLTTTGKHTAPAFRFGKV
jgi:hypothetical protein